METQDLAPTQTKHTNSVLKTNEKMLPCSLKLTIIYILASYWSSKKKKNVLQYKRV